MFESPLHDNGQFIREGRLEMREAGLAKRDQRRIDGLVRPALRPQRQARRRRDQQEPRVLVTAVIERIETARDERVVDRADRQQAFAEQRGGQAQRREHQEQVVFRDAQFDVLARLVPLPLLWRGNFRTGKDILQMLPPEQPTLTSRIASTWAISLDGLRSFSVGLLLMAVGITPWLPVLLVAGLLFWFVLRLLLRRVRPMFQSLFQSRNTSPPELG